METKKKCSSADVYFHKVVEYVETCHCLFPFSNQSVHFSHRVLSSTNSNLPGNSDFENIFIYTHTLAYILHVEGGQFSSVTQSCPTPCYPMDCIMSGSLSITKSWSLLKLMSIESVMPSNHLILYHPLILLPSIFPSIRVFSNESVLHISCGQRIGVSASASVLPMNIQD